MSCDILQNYHEKRLRARKPHKCCETGRMIQPGEFYWRCSGLLGREWETHIQSESAYHFSRWLNKQHSVWGECEYGFGAVADGVQECGDPDLLDEWQRVCRGEITRPGA